MMASALRDAARLVCGSDLAPLRGDGRRRHWFARNFGFSSRRRTDAPHGSNRRAVRATSVVLSNGLDGTVRIATVPSSSRQRAQCLRIIGSGRVRAGAHGALIPQATEVRSNFGCCDLTLRSVAAAYHKMRRPSAARNRRILRAAVNSSARLDSPGGGSPDTGLAPPGHCDHTPPRD